MEKTLLLTLRHPGPSYFVAEALRLLVQEFRVVVLATDSAVPFFANRYSDFLEHPRITFYVPDPTVADPTVDETFEVIRFVPLDAENLEVISAGPSRRISPTQLELEDTDGILRLKEAVKQVLEKVSFTHVLRTTPASMIGVDEVLPTALRESGWNGSILCLQEYYGVGLCLEGEHPALPHGVSAIATVDPLAADMLAKRFSSACIQTIGWIGNESFLSAPPFAKVRAEGRKQLGVSLQQVLILYACICSNLPNQSDLRDFVQVVQSVRRICELHPEVVFSLKPHPRMAAEEVALYQEVLAEHEGRIPYVSLESLSSYGHALAAPDLIISAASALNIDAIAYRSTAKLDTVLPEEGPVSFYTVDASAKAAIRAATGMDLLPTHVPGRGSFCSTYEELDVQLGSALFDRELRAEVQQQGHVLFGPTGQAAERLLHFILRGGVSDDPDEVETPHVENSGSA